MRELLKFVQKYSSLTFFAAFSALRGVNLVGRGVKYCVLMYQGQSGKLPFLRPEKRTIFPHLALFFTYPSQKSGTSTHFKITFSKST